MGNTVPFFGLGLQRKKELDLLQENIKDYYDYIDPRINEIDKEIESLKNRKYTWGDLAKLMYGDDIITDSKLGKKSSSDYKYENKK